MSGLALDMVTLVVPDYDAGIDYFTGLLGFDLIEDSDLGSGKRWVVVGGESGAKLLLARAVDEAQAAAIGNQAGGRVGFFLHTGNFAATYATFAANGVRFAEEPRYEAHGTVVVFTDPFGNRWDLIERRNAA